MQIRFAVNKIGVQPYIRVEIIPEDTLEKIDLSICHFGEQLCRILTLLLNDFASRLFLNKFMKNLSSGKSLPIFKVAGLQKYVCRNPEDIAFGCYYFLYE